MAASRRVDVGAHVLRRAVAFAVLWLCISGAARSMLVVGALAVAAATVTSVHLMPPGDGRPHILALARLSLRFLRQSVVAGVDVAWRALHPSLPLRPGFVRVPVRLPPGPRRDAFTTLTSLLPGTVPTGPDESGALLVHCLDVGQPVVEQLAVEEGRLSSAMGWERTDA